MKFFGFIAGFFETDAKQSMTRLGMLFIYLVVAAVICYQAYKGLPIDWVEGLTWIAAVSGLKLVQNKQENKPT
jgi:hypothetical protein